MKMGDSSRRSRGHSNRVTRPWFSLGRGRLSQGESLKFTVLTGKTTLTLHAIAEAQKGGIAAFIDAEHAFDRYYAENSALTLRTNNFTTGQWRASPGNSRQLNSQWRNRYHHHWFSRRLDTKKRNWGEMEIAKWDFRPDWCLKPWENWPVPSARQNVRSFSSTNCARK